MKWFKKLGWVYVPVNPVGWLLCAITLFLIYWVFMVADRNSHSNSDTLINTFPWAWIFTATLFWIASNTSRKN